MMRSTLLALAVLLGACGKDIAAPVNECPRAAPGTTDGSCSCPDGWTKIPSAVIGPGGGPTRSYYCAVVYRSTLAAVGFAASNSSSVTSSVPKAPAKHPAQ